MVKSNYDLLQLICFSTLNNWSVNSAQGDVFHTKLQLVPLHKVLTRTRHAIQIADDKQYKRITIKLYGMGVHLRDEVAGSEIGTKRQFVAHEGQLIISRIDARNGAFGIVPSELDGAIVTNDFWLFDVRNASKAFIMLLLTSDAFQRHWQSKSSGTTNRQRVNEQDFLNTRVPLPSLEEQNSVVEQYTKTTQSAEENERVAANLEESIQSMLDALLGIEEKKVNVNLGLNYIKFSDISQWGIEHLLKNKIIRTRKYKVVSLDSLCDVGSGGTPSRTNKNYYTGNIPWIKTGEVLNDIIYDSEEKITQEAVNNSSAKLYPKGSLIIAMYGQGLTRGRTAKLGVDATTNQACAVLYNINSEKVLTDFLWIYLQGEYNRLRVLASGNNQPNLNAQMIKKYPLVLPPIKSDNQNEITQEKIVTSIFEIKEKIKIHRQQAQDLYQRAKEQFEGAVFGEA